MYGFKGEGFKAGNPDFEIYKFFPEMSNWYGLLSGPAFSLSYAVAGIFVASLIQRSNRKLLLAGACIIWSTSSLVSSATNSFAVIFAMRFILGLFVSATEPVAFSLIGDYFPASIRTTANGVLGAGTYIGSASAAQFGYSTKAYGWRAAYATAGGFGAIVGLLSLLIMKDPRKGLQAEIEQEQSGQAIVAEELDEQELEIESMGPLGKFSASIKELMTHPVGFWATCAAMFRYIGIFACDYFGPLFYLRAYP